MIEVRTRLVCVLRPRNRPIIPSELTLPTLLLKTIRDQKTHDSSCVPPRYPTIQTSILISQTRQQLSHAFCLSIVPPTPPQSGTRPSSLAKCLTLVEPRAFVSMSAIISSVGQ